MSLLNLIYTSQFNIENWLLQEMKAISGKYEELYEETLAEAVEGDTSDGFGELLGRLVRGERDQSNSVDQKLVTQDAEDLYQVRLR